MVDLYRLLVHPSWERANWRDYRDTYQALGWLRAIPEPESTASTALIVLHREDIFDIKSSLMLAAGLKLRNVRSVLLAQHARTPRIRRYAKAFGIGTLRHRDEFPLTADIAHELRQRTRDMLRPTLAFEDVIEWTYEGHPLGQRLLSTLIRQTLQGTPDLNEPAIRRLLPGMLEQLLVNYHQAKAIVDAVDPVLVLAAEPGYGVNGPIVDVAICQGRDFVEVSPFLQDGALIFKRSNAHLDRAPCASVSASTLAKLETVDWTEEQNDQLQQELGSRYGRSALRRMYQWDTQEAGRADICREFHLDPQRSIAVIFSHVLWDASFFYGADLFASYGQWLEETVRAAITNANVNWLIKTHPSNAFRLAHGDVTGPVAEVALVERCFAKLPDHVRLVLPQTRVSSLSLYEHAAYGVTVRGTPGLEMACFGKPVLTAGAGHYTGFGFTFDSRTREEYLGRLHHIQSTPLLDDRQTVRARRYALALFRLRPWIGRSFHVRLDFPRHGWHPLDRNVIPRARSLAEATENEDLHRWADWATASRDADYLESDLSLTPTEPQADGPGPVLPRVAMGSAAGGR